MTTLRSDLDQDLAATDMYEFMTQLFPVCRSITGAGLRTTLEAIRCRVPELSISSVPSGTSAFDWTVPREWTIHDASIVDPGGTKVVDFAESNLHVVNYSTPVRCRMSLEELRPRIHTIPELPNVIPYRTSYYKDDWGFCMAHSDYEALGPGEYDVLIDSSLDDGVMNYGEIVLPGESDREVLLSAHACHPSLANDNLSGVVIATKLAEILSRTNHYYTYRVLFIPGGVGSILWMSRNIETLARVDAGLVLTCLGDPGAFTYKQTQRGNTIIDQAVHNVLENSGRPYSVVDFSPYGYDERNYCSARFDLPVGSLLRTQHAKFDEYHTSADNLDFVQPENLGESLAVYLDVLDVLETNRTYENLIPEAEPQLGKRGLYGLKGGLQSRSPMEVALLWVMNQSTGSRSLLDISDRSGIEFALIVEAAELLLEQDLLKEVAVV